MVEADSEALRGRQKFAASLRCVEQLKRSLLGEGLSPVEVERALQPALSFHAHLREELGQVEGTGNP